MAKYMRYAKDGYFEGIDGYLLANLGIPWNSTCRR
jgi:hypothetical protein